MKKINREVQKYIEENIISAYKDFDGGHNLSHVNSVIDRSLEYYAKLHDKYDLNIDMVYTIASYHDLGMKLGRKNHPEHSAKLVRQDKNLKRFFTESQINDIAVAVSEHSTSSANPPTSIYGMIVSDADKDRDSEIGIMRGYYFSLKNNKGYTFEEHVKDTHKEIVRRFESKENGGEGLVKFYISSEKNNKFVNEMLGYARDINKLSQKISEILKREQKA